MMKKLHFILIIFLVVALISGCTTPESTTNTEDEKTEGISENNVSQEEAQDLPVNSNPNEDTTVLENPVEKSVDDNPVEEEPADEPVEDPIEEETTEDSPKETVIEMTDVGYNPANVTINVGGTVKFINTGSREKWPASNNHPTHTLYPNSSIQKCFDESGQSQTFDACKGIATDESYSFTFNEIGEWAYHDHLRSSFGGTITVKRAN